MGKVVTIYPDDIKLKQRLRSRCVGVAGTMCAGTEVVEEYYVVSAWVNGEKHLVEPPIRFGELDKYCKILESKITITAECTDEFIARLKPTGFRI
jgi:hypothetical protein